MLRLFSFIFLAIAITLVVLNVGVNIVADQLLRKSKPEFYNETFAGVFSLLDDAHEAKHSDNHRATEKTIQSLFKYPVSLESTESLNLPATSALRLNNGHIVYSRVDNTDYLYKKSMHSTYAWRITAQMNEHDKHVALLQGPINLILSQIEGRSATEQKHLVKRISTYFAFPVLYLDEPITDLNSEDQERLQEGKTVAKNPGRNGERYFKQIDERGAYLQVGPIPLPPVFTILYPLITALFVLLAAAACSLWLRPLWHDLKQLLLASNTIASGTLEARVQTQAPSAIKSVLTAFNQMAEQNERMVESQRSLTNAVSHELRTPLARAKFSLEMAKNVTKQTDRERHMDNVSVDIDELNQLVDELLTYARYDQINNSILDRTTFHDIDVNAWLDAQISRAKRGIEGKIVISRHSSIEKYERALFHNRLMSYAFSNGIDNAIRYGNTKIEISLQRHGSDYLLSIDDDGDGISAIHHESLFEPFHRSDCGSESNPGGFGLGLSIVRKVAEWHEGSACLAASQLGGSQLRISWPVKQSVTSSK